MRIRIVKPRLSVALIAVGVIVLVVLALLATATYEHLGLPLPAGEYSVGKTYLTWADTSRPESLSPDPNDHRELPLQVWYRAEASGGPRESIPSQPFLLITKDSTWTAAAQKLVDSVTNASFTLIRGAEHQSFSDGPLLGVTLNPFGTAAQRTNGAIRAAIVQFLSATL